MEPTRPGLFASIVETGAAIAFPLAPAFDRPQSSGLPFGPSRQRPVQFQPEYVSVQNLHLPDKLAVQSGMDG